MNKQTKSINVGLDTWISAFIAVVLSFFLIYWLLDYSALVSALFAIAFAGITYTVIRLAQIKNELIDTRAQLDQVLLKLEDLSSSLDKQ